MRILNHCRVNKLDLSTIIRPLKLSFKCQSTLFFQYSLPTVTVLDQLTMETLANLNNNQTIEETEKKIYNFFTEDAIIARTQDCQAYFEKYISATAMKKRNLTNVSDTDLTIKYL